MKNKKLNLDKFRIAKLKNTQNIRGGHENNQSGHEHTDPPDDPDCILTSEVHTSDLSDTDPLIQIG